VPCNAAAATERAGWHSRVRGTDNRRMPLSGEYEPSPQQFVADQVEAFERSDGAEGNTMMGKPVIVLTTQGARSGKIRKTPLMRVEHGGKYAVVASKGGAPSHPVWYHNISANPQVELQDGPNRREYRAHEATGEERALWWDRAVQAWPDYAEYQKKTDREIPLFVLEPVDA
jgi:F420H(2)-dependent quinone reductase